MRSTGFFRERYGVGPSIEDARAAEAHPDEDRIVAYLDAGAVLLISPEVATDPLRPGLALAEQTVLSDGEWVWPGELGELVRAHHVQVPDELVDRMRAVGWRPPALDDEQVGAALDAFLAEGPLTLVEERWEGDPLAAPTSMGEVPPEAAAAAGVLPLDDPPTMWDYAEQAGLDLHALVAEGRVTPDGALAPEVLAEIGSRLGWHPPDPVVEREVEAVLRSFHAVLLGRAERVDPAAVGALAARGDDPEFWRWLGGSVAEEPGGLALLYAPETVDLLRAVVETGGDAEAVEARLGPMRMAGLRATAAVVEALEETEGGGS